MCGLLFILPQSYLVTQWLISEPLGDVLGFPEIDETLYTEGDR